MDALWLIAAAGILTLALLVTAHLFESEATQRVLAYAAVSAATLTTALILDVAAHARFDHAAAVPQNVVGMIERD